MNAITIFVYIIEANILAKSVEEVDFVNMVDKKVDAKSAELSFVNMVDEKVCAKSAEEVVFVNMVDIKVDAKNVLYIGMEYRHLNAQNAYPKNVFLVLLV